MSISARRCHADNVRKCAARHIEGDAHDVDFADFLRGDRHACHIYPRFPLRIGSLRDYSELLRVAFHCRGSVPLLFPAGNAQNSGLSQLFGTEFVVTAVRRLAAVFAPINIFFIKKVAQTANKNLSLQTVSRYIIKTYKYKNGK